MVAQTPGLPQEVMFKTALEAFPIFKSSNRSASEDELALDCQLPLATRCP